MFITKTKHEAALAERDATIAGLMRRLESANAAVSEQSSAASYYARERDKALARLTPFTTYTRGAGGRFVKKGVE